MAREQFRYDGTKDLCKLIDEAGHRAGVSRGQAFEDFLSCVVCALSAQQMEDEYLAVVAKGYADGKNGRRGIDSITQAFATLVMLMEDTRKDILGDCFEGAVSYGERGQFLTPPELCELMARLNTDESAVDEVVSDPCCGSGRMLLAYAEHKRPRELVGQDVDRRCVHMTGINMALRNMYGFVLWGDSLRDEVKLAYRTGQNIHGGFIRYARPGELAGKLGNGEPADDDQPKVVVTPPSRPEGPMKQLGLF